MIATVNTGVLQGLDAQHVLVEVNIVNGLPAINIVGLPDAAIREARERVRSAISSSEYDFPLKRITVNLAPADLRKEGPSFDLPIALGILAAAGYVNKDGLDKFMVAGELSLRGEVRGARGVLALTMLAKQMNKKGVIVPWINKEEARLVQGIKVVAVNHLIDAVDYITRNDPSFEFEGASDSHTDSANDEHGEDYADVRGQKYVKRAVEIAVAGGHNLLMIGPPGSGKTMMAKRIPSIMPPLELNEAIELTKIASAAGQLAKQTLIYKRPFRDPHHSISYTGLVGGGQNPRPGEITLSYLGVLFLDELPEFDRRVLEVLRQPLESGEVTIARASGSVKFPARFMMVAGMNPCKCGYLGDSEKECLCSGSEIRQYRSKISGPLIDRIDIYSEVARPSEREIVDQHQGESSRVVRGRVMIARDLQRQRFKDQSIASFMVNAGMDQKAVTKYCRLKGPASDLLKMAYEKTGMSARGYMKTLKVARTIADLDNSEGINTDHLSEALQLRSLDLKYFNS